MVNVLVSRLSGPGSSPGSQQGSEDNKDGGKSEKSYERALTVKVSPMQLVVYVLLSVIWENKNISVRKKNI